MPVLANDRWEKYAIARAKGLPIAKAQAAAGYPVHAANGSRLEKREQIRSRIIELREKAAWRADVTVAKVVEGIADIAFADEGVKIPDKLKGLELLGRYLSMFQENLNVNVSSDLAARMREAQARMRSMRNVTPVIEAAD